MKNMKVADLVKATGGELLQGDLNTEIISMTTDSRTVKEGDLFVPIVGENQDGHIYLEKALDNGASVTLTADKKYFEEYKKKNPTTEKSFIYVSDTTDGIQKIAKAARLKLSLPAIGVTGSVGKTTTREMISCALSAEKKVYKTDKNFNNWLGVPITLCDMSDDYDVAVLELGMNVPGELGLISSLTNIETAVVTNIGVAHIEFYGTQEKIADEKLSITQGFSDENPNPKMLFLNGDDPYLYERKDQTGFDYRLYGVSEKKDLDYFAKNISVEGGLYHFNFCKKTGEIYPVTLKVLGVHNILNAVCALGIADYYGMDIQKSIEKLSEYTGYNKRLERIENQGYLIIDDTYNASPQSMKAGVDVLCSYEDSRYSGKRIAVLGDMFELGENAPAFHYGVGVDVAKKPVDCFYLVGKNAKEIQKGILKENDKAVTKYYEEKSELLEELKRILSKGDVLYIKASNGMKLHDLTEGLLNAGK